MTNKYPNEFNLDESLYPAFGDLLGERSTVDGLRLWDPPPGEPNNVSFTHEGLPCCVLRNPNLGFLTAYVAVSKNHPFFGLDADNSLSEQLSGINTRASRGKPDSRFLDSANQGSSYDVSTSTLPRSVGDRLDDLTIGYHTSQKKKSANLPPKQEDCALQECVQHLSVHGGVTFADTRLKRLGTVQVNPFTTGDHWIIGFDCLHAGDSCPLEDPKTRHLPFTSFSGSYKTMDWVIVETKRLAEQLAEVGT